MGYAWLRRWRYRRTCRSDRGYRAVIVFWIVIMGMTWASAQMQSRAVQGTQEVVVPLRPEHAEWVVYLTEYDTVPMGWLIEYWRVRATFPEVSIRMWFTPSLDRAPQPVGWARIGPDHRIQWQWTWVTSDWPTEMMRVWAWVRGRLYTPNLRAEDFVPIPGYTAHVSSDARSLRITFQPFTPLSMRSWSFILEPQTDGFPEIHRVHYGAWVWQRIDRFPVSVLNGVP